MKDIWHCCDPTLLETFFGNTIVYMTRQSLIAWLNWYCCHQLPTIALNPPPPVSVLGHCWPTFSLFLPVQSSAFAWLQAEFFLSSSVQTVKGVSITSKRPSYMLDRHQLSLMDSCPFLFLSITFACISSNYAASQERHTFQFSSRGSSHLGLAVTQKTLVSRDQLGLRELWSECRLQLPRKK